MYKQYVMYDFEQIAVDGSTAITAAKLNPSGKVYKCDRIDISVTIDDVSMRQDGTAPTALVGMYLAKNLLPLTIEGYENIVNIHWIKVTNAAKVNVTYFYAKN